MDKELLIFVPGLSARAPDKYTGKLRNNLEKYAEATGGKLTVNASGAGAAVSYTYQPADIGEPPRQIMFREVVWGDIPARLSEQPAPIKFRQGFRLLVWVIGSLRAIGANKYQLVSLLGALLVLFFWYVGVVLVAVPLAVDYSLLPSEWAGQVQEFLGSLPTAVEGLSVHGVPRRSMQHTA